MGVVTSVATNVVRGRRSGPERLSRRRLSSTQDVLPDLSKAETHNRVVCDAIGFCQYAKAQNAKHLTWSSAHCMG